jgi:hypothetical protein
MPSAIKTYPLRLELPHDVVAYFSEQSTRVLGSDQRSQRPLSSYPAAEFVVDDARGLSRPTETHLLEVNHAGRNRDFEWELESPLRVLNLNTYAKGRKRLVVVPAETSSASSTS